MNLFRTELDTVDWLIADYLEPDPTHAGVTAYRLRGSHLPVHEVVRYALAAPRAPRELGDELGVYYKAIDAALAYYARHREAFAWRLAQPAARAATWRAWSPPWWLSAMQIIGLGVVSTIIGVLLAMWTR